jgi:hypothetical protein
MDLASTGRGLIEKVDTQVPFGVISLAVSNLERRCLVQYDLGRNYSNRSGKSYYSFHQRVSLIEKKGRAFNSEIIIWLVSHSGNKSQRSCERHYIICCLCEFIFAHYTVIMMWSLLWSS